MNKKENNDVIIYIPPLVNKTLPRLPTITPLVNTPLADTVPTPPQPSQLTTLLPPSTESTESVDSSYVCYICHETIEGRVRRFCKCRGTNAVHKPCLQKWIRTSQKTTCTICKTKYKSIDIPIFWSKVFIDVLYWLCLIYKLGVIVYVLKKRPESTQWVCISLYCSIFIENVVLGCFKTTTKVSRFIILVWNISLSILIYNESFINTRDQSHWDPWDFLSLFQSLTTCWYFGGMMWKCLKLLD